MKIKTFKQFNTILIYIPLFQKPNFNQYYFCLLNTCNNCNITPNIHLHENTRIWCRYLQTYPHDERLKLKFVS